MIDLSCDLGEASTDSERETEARIWPLIASANVACGGHAGNRDSMTYAARQARQLGVHLGAHPSFPDRENFGRKPMVIAPEDLLTSLADQIATLRRIAGREGVDLRFVKPHGALYNQAHRDRALAATIVAAMRQVDPALAIVAPAASQMAVAARTAGTSVIAEAFADRRYEPTGELVARGTPGALLTVDEAAGQAEHLVREGIAIARDGTRVPIEFDTVCIHADMERSVERLMAIRARLGMQ
ncbi:MAG TPA: 5-oxoprolinase subunit PxpA [Thermoanaerobaculia bacterium]|nr:5-oxoprolinase subunit PxpA [Thermoanaerobaculia bacterium]